jgi:predicted transcriptional regulator of viral defense system
MSNNTEHNAHNDVRGGRSSQDALYAVAESQAGYFTTAQAGSAGYSRSLVSHHAKTGTFARARTGVYRLSRFPASSWEDLFIAWLQAGPEAVVSHESALALFDLSDVMPSEMHFTLPRTSSRRRPHIRMHTSALAREDVAMREGLPVTSVARTIEDVARAGMSEGNVEQAITQALERGLASESLLRDRAERSGGRARRLILAALDARSER